jgi:hypothetical protein
MKNHPIIRLAFGLLFALGSLGSFNPATAEPIQSAPENIRSLDDPLTPDNTLNLPLNFQGSPDVRDFPPISGVPEMLSAAGDERWTAFSGFYGIRGSVYAIAVDASENVYIGGNFTMAGNVVANRVAMWDGSAWHALGDGFDDKVYALALDAAGNLYAGGYFEHSGTLTVNYIAKWDGSSWSALGDGTNANVNAILTSGSDVYVGGAFNRAGGLLSRKVARWDGAAWNQVGYGFSGIVFALEMAGNYLYAGGDMAERCDNENCSAYTRVNRIAEINVTNLENDKTWDGLQYGFNNTVRAMAIIDSPTRLYAGGNFTQICGNLACSSGNTPVNYIAKWNQTTWTLLGNTDHNGVNGAVLALREHTGGIFVGGNFTTVHNADGDLYTPYIARWAHETGPWNQVMDASGYFGTNSQILALAYGEFTLYAGGMFNQIVGGGEDYLAVGVAAFDSAWSRLGSETYNGVTNCSVTSFAQIGGDLYIGGEFTIAGGVEASFIARWDGNAWHALGDPGQQGLDSSVYAMAASGDDLYVAGFFTFSGAGQRLNNIARWDGSEWHSLGYGTDYYVNSLAVDENYLYAAGPFTNVGDVDSFNVPANHIARWSLSGHTWSALNQGSNYEVTRLALSGNSLYAGGWLTAVGNAAPDDTPANYLARWNTDSETWGSVGYGLNANPWTLTTDPAGNLYAGGTFNEVCGNAACGSGNTEVNYIAQWNGATWSALGSGMDDYVSSLVYYEGALYASGDFNQAGGVSAAHIARWDPITAAWSALGSGIDNSASALFGDNNGYLYAGGSLTQAGGVTSTYLARYSVRSAHLISPVDETNLTPPGKSVTLTWEPVTGATKYRVRTSTNNGRSWRTVNKKARQTSHRLGGLSKHKTYLWKIQALVGSAWVESDSWVFRPPYPPAKPALKLPKNNAKNQPLQPALRWKNSKASWAVDYYLLQVKPSGGSWIDLARIDAVGLPATVDYTITTDLLPNTLYLWRVNACNDIDQCSGTSSVRRFRTLTPAP